MRIGPNLTALQLPSQCTSEPRLAFNKIVVTRYRIFLEQASIGLPCFPWSQHIVPEAPQFRDNLCRNVLVRIEPGH